MSTVSERALRGIDTMMLRALRAGLAGAQDVVDDVAVVTDVDGIPESRAVMLSIAAIACRIVAIVYFEPDEYTQAHFARLHRVDADAMSESALLDALAESGNVICGALNRDLGPVLTHVGMSTPRFVDRDSARHLGLLPHAHVRHYTALLNQQSRFHASLCVCPYEPLDFEPPVVAEVVEETAGELELF